LLLEFLLLFGRHLFFLLCNRRCHTCARDHHPLSLSETGTADHHLKGCTLLSASGKDITDVRFALLLLCLDVSQRQKDSQAHQLEVPGIN
jgi:hypothetical protein